MNPESENAATTDPETPLRPPEAAEADRHVRAAVVVFGALLVLTLVTVGISYLGLPTTPAVVLALVVASAKGVLVACYFMHLLSERKLVLGVVALAVLFLLALLVLPALTELDQVGV